MSWFQKKAPDARPRSGSGPAIHALLRESSIILPAPGVDKAGVLEALVTAAAKAHGLGDPAALLARVREREQGISTTLDSGLSLPHARVDGLERVAAALAVLRQSVVDPKQPEPKVRAMFLFFSPNRQEAFTEHLHVLRGVSSLFQPALIDKLCGLDSAADVLAAVRAAEG